MTRIGRIFVSIAAICGALALATAGWIAWRTWPRKLPYVKRPGPAAIYFRNGEPTIASQTSILMAEVGDYDSTLQGYLYFDFLRSQAQVDTRQSLFCSRPTPACSNRPVMCLRVDVDMLHSTSYLRSSVAASPRPNYSLDSWLDADLAGCRRETEKFVEEFN